MAGNEVYETGSGMRVAPFPADKSPAELERELGLVKRVVEDIDELLTRIETRLTRIEAVLDGKSRPE